MVGDLENLKFEYDYFDLGVFQGVIHHIKNDELVENSIDRSTDICKRVIINESIQSDNFMLKTLKSFLWSIYDSGRKYYTSQGLNDIYNKFTIKKKEEYISKPLKQHYLAVIFKEK